MDKTSSTAVFVGNLKKSGRIWDLKSALLTLFHKVLNVQVSLSDISIINGSKKYAIIDAHHQQNVDYILENLSSNEDRRKLKFDFLQLVDKGIPLHVDRMKARDQHQARADFQNAKNLKPFQIPHRPRKVITRQDVHSSMSLQQSMKTSSSKSVTMKPSVTGRAMSRSSVSTTRGDNPNTSQSSIQYMTTDLDVTIEEGSGMESGRERKVHIVPTTMKEESDDSGAQSVTSDHPSESSRPAETESLVSDYEDPPGSVIDLRRVQRNSMTARCVGPKVRRRPLYDIPSKTSTSREDFFSFLDSKVSDSKTVAPKHQMTSTPRTLIENYKTSMPQSSSRHHYHHVKDQMDADEGDNEEDIPFYKLGERVLNENGKREFKALDGVGNIKQLREHVGRCVTGFLNSGQQGILLLGVETDGTVVGIDCDPQQEDRYWRHFDEEIKDIYPPIYEEDYSIQFLPILENNGRQHPELKVIEIRTENPDKTDLLYECKEGVFVRRNNVLTGPIKARHIQEWIKVRHFNEVAELRQRESAVRDSMEKKDLLLRKQADTITAQESQILSQKHQLESKSCVLL